MSRRLGFNDDSYSYDQYYYNDGEDRLGPSTEEEPCRDPISDFERPRTPRSCGSLEEVIRRRTPSWISKVLKTHIREDVELEDLFANCWLLGRIADVLLGVLREEKTVARSQSPLPSPLSSNNTSFSLGERPYRAMMQDFAMFMDLCERLDIREESRFTISDVEQKRDGEKIGMCLWDICNALHDKSMTGDLPKYVGRVVPKFTDPQVSSPSPMKAGEKKAFVTPTSQKIRFRLSGDDEDEHAIGEEDPDGSTRVLASILTSNKSKPRHTKLLNAVMMTDFNDEEEDNSGSAKSPLPKVVDSLDSSAVLTNRVEVITNESGELPVAEKEHHGREVDTERPAQKKQGGLPGLVIIGISMAAGFALSSLLASRKVASRRHKDSRYTMEGRW